MTAETAKTATTTNALTPETTTETTKQAALIRRMVDRDAFAIHAITSTENGRYNLNAILATITPTDCILQASNAKMLFRVRGTTIAPDTNDGDVAKDTTTIIIPANVAKRAYSAAKSGDALALVQHSADQWAIEIPTSGGSFAFTPNAPDTLPPFDRLWDAVSAYQSAKDATKNGNDARSLCCSVSVISKLFAVASKLAPDAVIHFAYAGREFHFTFPCVIPPSKQRSRRSKSVANLTIDGLVAPANLPGN